MYLFEAMKRQHEAEVNEMNGRFECLKSSLMVRKSVSFVDAQESNVGIQYYT